LCLDNNTALEKHGLTAGNGRIIYQAFPNGTTTVWANITVTGACKNQAGAGGVVGVTMALSRCGSVIIVGSLPIPGGADGTLFLRQVLTAILRSAMWP